jgi:HK97 gp10 family phage protein
MPTKFEFRSRVVEAREMMRADIRAAIADVFQIDIKADAVENSPVTPEGVAHNVELKAAGKLGSRPPVGTGHNRRSIDVTVTETDKGPQAQLFTQSGYGGYLELGTSKMRAQPYLFPAFQRHIAKLPAKVRAFLGQHGRKGTP